MCKKIILASCLSLSIISGFLFAGQDIRLEIKTKDSDYIYFGEAAKMLLGYSGTIQRMSNGAQRCANIHLLEITSENLRFLFPYLKLIHQQKISELIAELEKRNIFELFYIIKISNLLDIPVIWKRAIVMFARKLLSEQNIMEYRRNPKWFWCAIFVPIGDMYEFTTYCVPKEGYTPLSQILKQLLINEMLDQYSAVFPHMGDFVQVGVFNNLNQVMFFALILHEMCCLGHNVILSAEEFYSFDRAIQSFLRIFFIEDLACHSRSFRFGSRI